MEDETDDEEGEDEDDESNDSKEENEKEERHSPEVANGDRVKDMTVTENMPIAGGSKTGSIVPSTITSTSRSQVAVDTSQEKPSNSEVIDSAAALLADSIYTSAPKRRRHR